MESISTVRKENWKQSNPREQSIAILSGIEGLLDNIQDGTTDAVSTIPIILKQIQDLKELHKFLSDTW